ncbi:MAG: hypothetical protein IRZ03_17660, partial [Acidobacterium ailaaui]|nr:hypothetical protein [Pseudacidobacterium ailaaui]
MAVNPSNWEEDLRKRGAAARAKLLYRADDQPQQRQPLAYIPDDATASQPSGRLQYIPDRQEAKTPQTIPVPASNGVSKPQALTPGEFLTQTNKALQNGGWNLPAVAAANPSTKPTAEELKIAQQIAKNDEDRAKTGAPKWLQNAAGEIDRFVMNNPVGKGLKRFSQASAEVFGITPESVGEIQASTGNKALDKALDVAGGLAGYATNPAQIESNLISGTYNAARSALNTGVGQKIEQGLQNAASRIANRLAPGLSPRVTDRLVTGALEGGAANALQNAAIGAMAGQTSGQDVARNALIGGLLGG